MDVKGLREQIPVCRAMTYVNTGWSGPSPAAVVKAIKDRLDYEMSQGPTSPEVYRSGREIQDGLRQEFAALINAAPEEICLTKNTTEGLNIAINGLTWSQGDEIITCDLEHSSVLTPAYFQQHRHGALVKVLPLAPDESRESILKKVEDAISERTKLVFLSHVQYSSGLRMPVKEIRSLTKNKGVLMLLDGAQAAGQVPLDMADMDCDFYALPGQKWLLGPEGVGALYIRRDLIPQVEPTFVSERAVISDVDPRNFELNQGSIDKLLLSSTNAALEAGMLRSIRFVREIGVAEIAARNVALAGALKQELSEIEGVRVLTPMEDEGSSGLVSFAIEKVSPEAAVSRLWEEHRIVARHVSSPLCLRVSLHFFNTEEEVEKVAEAIRGMA